MGLDMTESRVLIWSFAAGLALLGAGAPAGAVTTTKYQLMLQTRTDANAPDEVFIASYSSFANVLANAPSSSNFTQIGINPAYEIVGFSSVTTTIVDPPPPVGGVPEPSSWALLLLGFGSTGILLRRRGAVAPR